MKWCQSFVWVQWTLPMPLIREWIIICVKGQPKMPINNNAIGKDGTLFEFVNPDIKIWFLDLEH